MAAAKNAQEKGAETGTIAALRARIRHLEHGEADSGRHGVCPLGLSAIDESLPGGGISRVGLHEVAGPVDGRGDGAAMGFALALAGRFVGAGEAGAAKEIGRSRIVIWVGPHDDLFAPALAPFGLAANALIRVKARGKALLWALEEALRSAAAAAVVAECDGVDLTASRRLQLAAEAGSTPALLLRRRLTRNDGSDAGAVPIAAHTRWLVTSLSSLPEMTPLGPVPGVGYSAWRLELVRSRGGRPGRWDVVWQGAGEGEGHGFSLMPARMPSGQLGPVSSNDSSGDSGSLRRHARTVPPSSPVLWATDVAL
ncbi:hypothetical protein [Fodinicurvata sp. EGI_FJ10296]|uniref:ImuA family protein n=1 Tax=Fodinicurvata sp. EGI_FJ10296 TaxID=3231908 RepID=UPI003454A318